MVEIKFLKDLPIKLTNNNKSVLTVLGGDIYYDSDGNRYGFISFRNTNKSPIFALQLAIREYSVDGKFIRDNELFEGYTYYPTGDFVINQPILLDKEAEAIEVTIVKITFRKSNFVNDKFIGFKKEDYVNLYQSKAPVKRNANPGAFIFQSAQPSQAAPVAPASEKVNEAPAVNEEMKDLVNNAKQDAAPVAEAAPVNEVPASEITNFAKEKPLFPAMIPFLAGILVLLIIVFIVMNTVTGGVSVFIDNYPRYR